jgi:hypothetical protein
MPSLWQTITMPKQRELVWTNLAASCSACGWVNTYRVEAGESELGENKITAIVRQKFADHKCEKFPREDFNQALRKATDPK